MLLLVETILKLQHPSHHLTLSNMDFMLDLIDQLKHVSKHIVY